MAVVAYNALSVLKRGVEHAHRDGMPQLDVSTYYLALDIKSEYEGMLIALPATRWASWSEVERRGSC